MQPPKVRKTVQKQPYDTKSMEQGFFDAGVLFDIFPSNSGCYQVLLQINKQYFSALF